MRTLEASLAPDPSELGEAIGNRVNERGMPTREIRDELRTIDDRRNALTVAGALAQSYGVVGAAAVANTWWAYSGAFVFMARGHVCLNILAHEAAHRLLFNDRNTNDKVGRWLLGYPTLQPMLRYRRAHFAHHRDELGPDEPDLALYAGYPVPGDSWRRKLWRDLRGNSAKKNIGALVFLARSGDTEARQVLGIQAGMALLALLARRPLAWLVWIGSWSTLWKVSNRLRSIAEHGGMVRSRDRRQTTHVIKQDRLSRFWIAPYHTGLHLAHHADMGVPWRNLPRLHAELVEAGWVTDDLEHRSYLAFWRKASSGPARSSTGGIDADPVPSAEAGTRVDAQVPPSGVTPNLDM